jgi:hypothetical protein
VQNIAKCVVIRKHESGALSNLKIDAEKGVDVALQEYPGPLAECDNRGIVN